MRLTKLLHACVRLEKDGSTLVIDPGVWAGPEALAGANAVLVTHEHYDHVDVDGLKAALAGDPELQVWTHAGVAAALAGAGYDDRVHAVSRGERFDAAGFDVLVQGENHALLHPEIPVVPNVGFVVDGEIFHPGDALTVPDQRVSTPAAGQRALAEDRRGARLRTRGGSGPRVRHSRRAGPRPRCRGHRQLARARGAPARRDLHPAGARYLRRPVTCAGPRPTFGGAEVGG